MPSNVVRVKIDADARGFEQGFDKAEAKAVGFGAAVGTLAGNIAFDLGRKAVGAVTDFVGSSLTAFSDLNESLNALEVQYGDNADGIKKLGEEAAQAIGASNAEFNGYAVSISAFAQKIAGDSGDVVGVVDELSKRTADFASVMNLDFGEAADKFRSGLSGESEPLRQYGIDVSAAAVETQALTDGIWDGVGAMTEDEKVRARFNAIMAQTEQVHGDFANTADDAANKQRILTAEMENQKALLGQALLPLQETWLDIQSKAIPIIADLAVEIGLMTGALSDAEAMLLQFQQGEGRAVESAEDLAKALTVQKDEGFNPLGDSIANAKQHSDNWTEAAKEAIETTGLSTEELAKLRDEFKLMESQGVITEGQLDEVTDAINEQIVADQQAARDAGRHRGAREELTGAEGELEGAIDDTNVEIKTQNELLKESFDRINNLIDPAFDYMQGQRKLAEAQKAYNEAVKEFGENSPEAIAAAEGIAEANMGIQEAVIAIGEEGVPAAMEALASMGVPESVIQKFGEDKKRIEEIFRNFVLRIGVSAPSLFPTSPSGGGVGWRTDTNVYYPHGGIARRRPGGQQANIASTSDESVIPLNRQGAAFMAETMAQAFKMMGGNGNGGINITVHAGMGTNGHRVGEQIVEEIVRARRRGVQV